MKQIGATRYSLAGCLRLGLLPVLVAGAGCARTPPGPVVRYTLDPPSAVTATAPAGPAARGSLAVRAVDTAASFRRYWVARKDRFTLVQLAGYEWAEAPGEMVGRTLVRGLAATGRFRDVARAADRAQADWVISGEISDFSLDQTQTPWRAVCEMRFDLRPANGAGNGWSETLAADASLSANRIQAFPEAMSQAVAELVKKVAAALAEHAGPQPP